MVPKRPLSSVPKRSNHKVSEKPTHCGSSPQGFSVCASLAAGSHRCCAAAQPLCTATQVKSQRGGDNTSFVTYVF